MTCALKTCHKKENEKNKKTREDNKKRLEDMSNSRSCDLGSCPVLNAEPTSCSLKTYSHQ
jgi:hypothetical protein